MASILTVFVLLLVAAGLFNGSRALARSKGGSHRLAAISGKYPGLMGATLLLSAALLIALGFAAILMVISGLP